MLLLVPLVTLCPITCKTVQNIAVKAWKAKFLLQAIYIRNFYVKKTKNFFYRRQLRTGVAELTTVEKIWVLFDVLASLSENKFSQIFRYFQIETFCITYLFNNRMLIIDSSTLWISKFIKFWRKYFKVSQIKRETFSREWKFVQFFSICYWNR